MCNARIGTQPRRVSVCSLQGGGVPKAAEDWAMCWQGHVVVVGGEAGRLGSQATSGGVSESAGGM